MGRLTIFTVNDCRHCTRVKTALADRGVPYNEINLSSYPKKRQDMLSLTNRFTVPQVFLNDRHVGGADEIIALILDWEKDKGSSSLDLYRDGKFCAGPSDPRLAVPKAPPRRPPCPLKRPDNYIELPYGGKTSVLEITKTLMDLMPSKDKRWRARLYKDCFTGKQGVFTLMEHFRIQDQEEAIEFGRQLQRAHIIHHVTNDHPFGFTDQFFRLQPYHFPSILNSFRVWTERVDPNAMGIVERMKRLMSKVESAARDKNGLIDCAKAAQDPNYIVFEEGICELQRVSLGSMHESKRLAFAINVYNLMIQHAFIKLGVPTTPALRANFFSSVSYNIGGDILSFDEIEHGIIRANSRPPFQLSSPFTKSDPRMRLALTTLDPRIHFALNCGAMSCPPMKNFSSSCIDEELRVVAEAFCEDDENVSINVEKNRLSLSMIFSWYRSDFARSSSKLPQAVLPFLRGERREQLRSMIESGRPIAIKFKAYNWNPIATETKRFESSKIVANERSIQAFFSGNSIVCKS